MLGNMDRLEQAVARAIKAMGTKTALARGLGVTKGALYFWKRIPDTHVTKVSELTNIPVEELRPDLAEIFRK